MPRGDRSSFHAPVGTAMPRLAVNPVRVLEDQEERLRSRFRQQQPPQSVGRALAPLPRAPCMHHGQVPVVAPESARAVSVETPLGEAAPPSRACPDPAKARPSVTTQRVRGDAGRRRQGHALQTRRRRSRVAWKSLSRHPVKTDGTRARRHSREDFALPRTPGKHTEDASAPQGRPGFAGFAGPLSSHLRKLPKGESSSHLRRYPRRPWQGPA